MKVVMPPYAEKDMHRWNESKVEPGYGVFSGDWKVQLGCHYCDIQAVTDDSKADYCCCLLQHRYQEKDCEDAETTFAAAPRGLGLEDDYRKVCCCICCCDASTVLVCTDSSLPNQMSCSAA